MFPTPILLGRHSRQSRRQSGAVAQPSSDRCTFATWVGLACQVETGVKGPKEGEMNRGNVGTDVAVLAAGYLGAGAGGPKGTGAKRRPVCL